MLKRLIQEFRRREKVFRLFPNKDSVWQLIGALLAEKHEDRNLRLPRLTSWRYLKADEFYDWLHKQSRAEATKISSEQTKRTPQPA